jgi:hypothetical protein
VHLSTLKTELQLILFALVPTSVAAPNGFEEIPADVDLDEEIEHGGGAWTV